MNGSMAASENKVRLEQPVFLTDPSDVLVLLFRKGFVKPSAPVSQGLQQGVGGKLRGPVLALGLPLP